MRDKFKRAWRNIYPVLQTVGASLAAAAILVGGLFIGMLIKWGVPVLIIWLVLGWLGVIEL